MWSSPPMREDDGRKLDHTTLEQLRIRAVRQIEQGAHPADIARALGMTRAAVYAWLAKSREGGVEALKAKPVPGRPPTLSGAQLARVYHLVVGNDPRQLRFAVALWTRQMVRELIRREFHVALSEVTAKGALRFAAYQGNLNAVVFLDFCRRLLQDASGPVFLVLDGHPVHRSHAVKQFAASSGGRLRLCFLPGSSPELNPDAWVWKHVKHDRIGRVGVSSPDDLKAKALAALHRLQKLPHIVQGFFRDPNLRYITA